MEKVSRRDFLKLVTRGLVAAAGLLGLGMAARSLAYPGEARRQTRFDLGPAQAFPPGSRTLLPEVPALLVRGASGFRAISLTCTHLGCTLEGAAEGFSCPCHGSRFDGDGRVVRGPAVQDLRVLRVLEDDAGHVILFTE